MLFIFVVLVGAAVKRTWRITNPAAFKKRAMLAKESELLKWAGQFSTALRRDRQLALVENVPALPDLNLETRQTRRGDYRGRSWSLFPEMGVAGLKLFTGVEAELLEMTREGLSAAHAAAKGIQDRLADGDVRKDSPYISLSRGGTCMIVEGLD